MLRTFDDDTGNRVTGADQTTSVVSPVPSLTKAIAVTAP